MRRIDPSRHWVPGALLAATALVLIGAGASKKKRHEPPPPKADETVADVAYIYLGKETLLEGVGLVVGLDNTGGSPARSYSQQRLVDDMRKAGVENPNKLLESKKVSMVTVK